MHRIVLLLLIASLASCTSNGGESTPAQQPPASSGRPIDAAGHASVIYMKQGPPPFVVFLEGDGIPWLAGVIPNEDPTTGKPLALDMLLHTPNGAPMRRGPAITG